MLDPVTDRATHRAGRVETLPHTVVVSMLEGFATSCGYRLGEVFVDDTPPRLLGWASLLQAVTISRPVTVLVPDVASWRPTDAMLREMASRLARVTSAPLVLARSPRPAAASPTDAWSVTARTVPGTGGCKGAAW